MSRQLEREFRGDYFRGQFHKAKDPNGEVLSRNPGDIDTSEVAVPFSYEHLHEAVVSAKRSFPAWRRMSVQDRYAALQRYRETVRLNSERLASILSFEVGKPLWEARQEINDCLNAIDFFLNRGSQTAVEEKVSAPEEHCEGRVRFLPRGVMVVITPGAEPVLIAHAHFIPALLNGNTCVLKASKYAPFTGQLIAELIHDSNIPSGVLNVVQGNSEAARRLVIDPDVDGILYTGNYETAEKIKKQLLSDFWKTQIFETGGKNATLIWSDAQYEKALLESVLGAFVTSGQRCSNTSRILVHATLFDRFVEDFHNLAKKISVGYGLDETQNVFMGPLISERALEDYLRFQGIAVREGAEEIMRGKALERDKHGFYVSPSLHVIQKADPKSVYQKSEIHGPNAALYKVQDLEEAIEVINHSQYGLVAAVYSQAREIFLRTADELRVGIIHWNRPTTHTTLKLPHGGIRKSGNSRPMGNYAGYQCTYPVACLEMDPSEKIPDLPSALPKLGNA